MGLRIPRSVEIKKTVRYDISRAELLKRFRLPEATVLHVDGLVIGEAGRVLKAEVDEQPRIKATEVADAAE